jgi:hypothetical protein
MANKRLSDATRQASADKAANFMDSLMPTMGGSAVPAKPASVEEKPAAAVAEPKPEASPAVVPAQASPKPERLRKSGGVSLEELVIPNPSESEAFNKMVRVTDEHHELLRTLAFKYRKPMNVFVYNLIELLNQAYQKDQQKDA